MKVGQTKNIAEQQLKDSPYIQNGSSHEKSLGAHELLQKIAEIAASTKAEDALALEVTPYFELSDYFLILSGTSDRHVQGICNRILGGMEEIGISTENIEGYDSAHWALLDFGDVIVHVFYGPTRKVYDLDGLWSHAQKIDLPAFHRAKAA
jgi:ribosome-associated protein